LVFRTGTIAKRRTSSHRRGSTDNSAACHYIRLDQHTWIKWSDSNWSIFHWSDTEISSDVKNQKTGIILRFTV
jgi:hypothetical protein